MDRYLTMRDTFGFSRSSQPMTAANRKHAKAIAALITAYAAGVISNPEWIDIVCRIFCRG